MKRWWSMLLVLAGVSASGQVLVETNDVLALDPLANPHTLQAGAPFRLTVYATQAGAALPLTGYTGQWEIVDTADGATVATYTGAVVGANAMRFGGTVGAQLRVGGSYEAAARVYSGGALVGQISASAIAVAEGYCSTCRTVIVTGGGVGDGGVTQLVTSGSVTGSIVDTTLYLTGSASGASSGGMVAIAQWDLSGGGWSNKFDAIPQTYPAIRLLGCMTMGPAAGPTNSYNVFFRYNDDTNSRYSRHYQRWSDGTAQSPSLQLSNTIGVLSAIYDAPGNVAFVDLTVPCYAATSAWKTFSANGVAWGGNKVDQFVQPGRYMSTNPITSLTVFHSAQSNFVSGTLTLYGLPAP